MCSTETPVADVVEVNSCSMCGSPCKDSALELIEGKHYCEFCVPVAKNEPILAVQAKTQTFRAVLNVPEEFYARASFNDGEFKLMVKGK